MTAATESHAGEVDRNREVQILSLAGDQHSNHVPVGVHDRAPEMPG